VSLGRACARISRGEPSAKFPGAQGESLLCWLSWTAVAAKPLLLGVLIAGWSLLGLREPTGITLIRDDPCGRARHPCRLVVARPLGAFASCYDGGGPVDLTVRKGLKRSLVLTDFSANSGKNDRQLLSSRFQNETERCPNGNPQA